MFTFGETVTRLRAGIATDPYSGEPVHSWTTPARLPINGVAVEPRPSGEPVQDARNAVMSGFTLYMPRGADVTPADRVEVRGQVYAVLGEPADWRSPYTGWAPGVVVQVERVAG